MNDLNNTKDAKYDMVYFIRVPKTGSQAMIQFIRPYLRFRNNFNILSRTAPPRENPFPSVYRQEIDALESISQGEYTIFIGMHENYIEYGHFNLSRPIFMSLIRHPIEKEISWFYYTRSRMYDAINRTHFIERMLRDGGEKKWREKTFEKCVLTNDQECQYIPMNPQKTQSYKRQSLHFCGNHEACLRFGSPTAIQMAKQNVEKNFAVVGSWEDTEITLTVLEHYIPKYFNGALNLYKQHKEEISNINKNNEKPKVSEAVKRILYKNFTGELEFYYFCKQRLYKQYLAIINHNKLIYY